MTDLSDIPSSKDDASEGETVEESSATAEQVMQENPDVMKHAERIRGKTPAASQSQPAAVSTDELVQLNEQLEKVNEQLVRQVAETENVRKRADKQIEDAGKFAISSFSKDLVNVMENLCRTIDNTPHDKLAEDALLKALFDGVEMTRRELESAFEKNGISRLAPEAGTLFDHNFHQAVAQVETDQHAPGEIVQLVHAGYMLKDRLLRAAMVTVAKAPPQPVASEPDTDPEG